MVLGGTHRTWPASRRGFSAHVIPIRIARWFFTRTCARLLRPKLAQILCVRPSRNSALQDAFDRLQAEIDRCCEEQRLVSGDVTQLHYNLLGKDSSPVTRPSCAEPSRGDRRVRMQIPAKSTCTPS